MNTRQQIAAALRGGEVPDYGFGPMTPDTRAGRMFPAEMRQAAPDAFLSPAARAVLDYGPVPAQVAMSVAMQPVRAGEAIADAAMDPSIGTITNAGLQTALSIPTMGGLKAAAGALGAGYTAAGASDLMGAMASPAQASGGLTPDQIKRRDDLQRQIERNALRTGPQRRAVESELADLRAIEREFALAANKSKQGEYDQQVSKAEAMAAKARARDSRFSDSALKGVYEATGGPIPLAAGAAGVVGMLNRGAHPLKQWAEGTGAAFTVNNAPMGYDAIMSPPVNPEYEAVRTLADNLPDGHPQKDRYRTQAEDMLKTGQDRNPVNKAAWEQFTDPELMAKRLGMSILEGTGALVGARVPSLPGDIAEGIGTLKGRFLKGAETAGADASAAKATRNQARQAAAESKQNAELAELDALTTQRAVAEARQASTRQTAGPGQPLDGEVVPPTRAGQQPQNATSTNQPPSDPPVPPGNNTAVQGENQRVVRGLDPEDRTYFGGLMREMVEALKGGRQVDAPPPVRQVAPPVREGSDVRYFDKARGADSGKSQSELVRDFFEGELEKGRRFGKGKDDIKQVEALRMLEKRGVPDPINDRMFSKRYRDTDEIAQAHFKKPLNQFTASDFANLRKIMGEGKGKGLAIPLAAGAGGAAMMSGTDAEADPLIAALEAYLASKTPSREARP